MIGESMFYLEEETIYYSMSEDGEPEGSKESPAEEAPAEEIKAEEESAEQTPEWHKIMMTSLLAMLPPILVVLTMQKLFVKGLIESQK